jgi:uncharacterized protein (UPF0264 family)
VTGLLVSVRSADEVAAALQGGATLIDVKEPRRGSLGRADRVVWRDVIAQVRGRTPVSVACGELTDWDPDRPGSQVPDNVQYAKCGMAGCLGWPGWRDRWNAWRATLPALTNPVAVIYADAPLAAAPPALEVLTAAADAGCRVVLWDTFVKNGTDLMDHVTCDDMDSQVRLARHWGMLIVLAGSLTVHHVPMVMRWKPDFVAVRGAVCQGNRAGAICSQRVADFVQVLAANGHSRSRHPASSGPATRDEGPASVA